MLVQETILPVEEVDRVGVLHQTIVTKEILTDTEGDDQQMKTAEIYQNLLD